MEPSSSNVDIVQWDYSAWSFIQFCKLTQPVIWCMWLECVPVYLYIRAINGAPENTDNYDNGNYR